MSKLKYKRILLKLSGEVLQRTGQTGINSDILDYISDEIIGLSKLGVETGIVIGGGNIFRGLSASAEKMDRNHADLIGMLATMINSLALSDILEHKGLKTTVFTSMNMDEMGERFSAKKAVTLLGKGHIIIFGGGTGHSYFTTDTTAALRGLQINAEVIIKATKVDGVYNSDPVKNKKAVFFRKIPFKEVLKNNLRVMDLTAVSMCMDNSMPILVLNMNKKNNIKKAVLGKQIGTIIE